MYVSEKCTISKLYAHGFQRRGIQFFRNYPILVDKHDNVLIEMRIVITKNEKKPVIDVYDVCNNSIYTPFYVEEYNYRNKISSFVKASVENTLVELILDDVFLNERGISLEGKK